MSRPLNFLHLTTFYPPYSFGGDATGIYRLCHALGDDGHRVDVIHCVDAYHVLHPAPPPVQFPEHPSVTRHELRTGYGVLSPLLTQQLGGPVLKTNQIRRIIGGRQYDVVHFHNISLLGPRVLSLRSGDPPAVKLYTMHEHWLICPTHVLWKFNRRPCERPACLRCTLLARRPPQLWRYTGLLENACRNIDLFLSPSRFTIRMHRERGLQGPIAQFPYFLPAADEEWKDPAPRPHPRPYFLFVGRLERIKGLHTLIPLWSRVTDFDLLVAGAGTEEVALREYAASNPRIRFLGMLSQQQLGAYYFHAESCIVPSVTFETFGMISIESFMRKTPVIVRDLGALPEAVEDSGGGFVYRTDEDLLGAIARIGSSPRLRAELGEKGYQAFLRSWTPGANLTKYLSLVQNLMARKNGRVPPETAGSAADFD